MSAVIARSTFVTLDKPIQLINKIIGESTTLDADTRRHWSRLLVKVHSGHMLSRVLGRPLTLVRRAASLAGNTVLYVVSFGRAEDSGKNVLLSIGSVVVGALELALLPADVLTQIIGVPASYVSSQKTLRWITKVVDVDAAFDEFDMVVASEDDFIEKKFDALFVEKAKAYMTANPRASYSQFSRWVADAVKQCDKVASHEFERMEDLNEKMHEMQEAFKKHGIALQSASKNAEERSRAGATAGARR